MGHVCLSSALAGCGVKGKIPLPRCRDAGALSAEVTCEAVMVVQPHLSARAREDLLWALVRQWHSMVAPGDTLRGTDNLPDM